MSLALCKRHSISLSRVLFKIEFLAMSTTPTSDPEKKKVDVFDEDDAVLAQLGYTQGKWLCWRVWCQY